MLQLKVIFHAIILLIFALMFVRSSNTTIQLQFSRNQGSNVITLWCRNLSDSLSEPGAVFYLNGSELNPGNYPFFSRQNNQPGEVIFLINRQLEGMYSCGVGQVKSSPRSLIGKHNNNYYYNIIEWHCACVIFSGPVCLPKLHFNIQTLKHMHTHYI